MALVPVRTIYPGETITSEQVKPVEVTNPNISAGYASDISEVEGMISKQTLLPGRTIPVAALREPSLVTRGSLATGQGAHPPASAGSRMGQDGVHDSPRRAARDRLRP